jgi:hypothetical protein
MVAVLSPGAARNCIRDISFFLEHAGELRINILRRRKRVDHPNTKTVFWGLGRGPEPTQPTRQNPLIYLLKK